jgi:hypothetical protein
LTSGTFTVSGFRYPNGAVEQYDAVTDFPTLEISFRGKTQQTFSFKEEGKLVNATLSCDGKESLGQ